MRALKLVFLLNLIAITHLFFASDPMPGSRVEIKGAFAVCNEAHFMHASCFDGWQKGCPTCHDQVRIPEKISFHDTLYMPSKIEEREICAICLEHLAATRILEPVAKSSIVDQVSMLSKVAPIIGRPASFYDQQHNLLLKISKEKDPVRKADLMALKKGLIKSEFYYD